MQAIVLETHDLEISRLLASFGAFEKYLLNYETASKKRFARMHVFSWIFWFYKGEALFHIQLRLFDCHIFHSTSEQDLNTNLVCHSE